MEEALRERPPVVLKLRPPDPLKQRRAANAARRKPTAHDRALIDQAFDAERADGWATIAAILRRDERTVRTAYASDRVVRRWIHKTGGRYWANPMELWSNLRGRFDDRRPRARQAHALRQARTARGKFASCKKKAPPPKKRG